MKKMLDELKKLNNDVSVPTDFRTNVMRKITNIKQEEKNKHLNKYVISCVSAAAVVVLALVVTLSDNSAMNFDAKSSDMYLEGDMLDFNIATTRDAIENEDVENTMLAEDEVEKAEDTASIFKYDETPTNQSDSLSSPKGAYEDSELVNLETVSIIDIKNILEENKFKVLEESGEKIVVSATLNNLEVLLGEYLDVLVITEYEDKVIVEIKKEV